MSPTFLSGGKFYGTATVSSGATVVLGSGATIGSATVLSGGTLYVSGGGWVQDFVVSSGGVILAQSSGSEIAAVYSGAILSGGAMSGVLDQGTVASGGFLEDVGGSYEDTISGTELISGSGLANASYLATIASGGVQIVQNAEIISSFVQDGGVEVLSGPSYVASANSSANQGGKILAAGTADHLVISSGGTLLYAGGPIQVFNGEGSASTISTQQATNTQIDSGALVAVVSGASISGFSVAGGVELMVGTQGEELILPFTGEPTSTTIDSIVSNTTVQSGGVLVVSSGGVASGATVA